MESDAGTPTIRGGAVLEFDGLYKAYGDNQVLEGVGFTVSPGQMFGFCGANGAGKTTTMRIAMGLARADAGEVRWRGRPLDEAPRRRGGHPAGGGRGRGGGGGRHTRGEGGGGDPLPPRSAGARGGPRPAPPGGGGGPR